LGYPRSTWFGVERAKVKVTRSVSAFFTLMNGYYAYVNAHFSDNSNTAGFELNECLLQ